MTLMNGYDIYISAVTQNLEELDRFIKGKMNRAAGFFSVETIIAGKILKRYYGASYIENLLAGQTR
jgi:DNA-binding Lrp family transcriptional regulator